MIPGTPILIRTAELFESLDRVHGPARLGKFRLRLLRQLGRQDLHRRQTPLAQRAET
jgi:hypothetical protein